MFLILITEQALIQELTCRYEKSLSFRGSFEHCRTILVVHSVTFLIYCNNRVERFLSKIATETNCVIKGFFDLCTLHSETSFYKLFLEAS